MILTFEVLQSPRHFCNLMLYLEIAIDFIEHTINQIDENDT